MEACPFCALAVEAGENSFALRIGFFLIVPVPRQRVLNQGHVVIVPSRHVASLEELEEGLRSELVRVTGRVSRAARAAFGATGTTLLLNENAPDQTLHHLHIHVIPRHAGDGFRVPDGTKMEVSDEVRHHQAEALRRALDTPSA